MGDVIVRVLISVDRLPDTDVMGNSRLHYQEKAKLVAKERMYMYLHCLENRDMIVPDEPYTKARISHDYWNAKEIDCDNYLIGCKAWQDALVDAHILKDDKPSNLELGHVRYHKCKKGEEKAEITLDILERIS